MMTDREDRKIPSESDYVEALILGRKDRLDHAWSRGRIRTPVNITYSFQIPQDTNPLLLSTETKLSRFGYSQIGAINSYMMEFTRLAMEKWSRVANIQFEENNQNPQIIILEGDALFESGAAIQSDFLHCNPSYVKNDPYYPFKCYEMAATSYLVLNRRMLNFFFWTPKSCSAALMKILVHELGHLLGLHHPFESPLLDHHSLSVTMSVMNYEIRECLFDQGETTCIDYDVISPSYYDIHAAQYLFSQPLVSGGEHNLVDLASIVRQAEEMSLPTYRWFGRMATIETLLAQPGINTLSAKDLSETLTINLNAGPFYRSQLNQHYWALVGNFENVIGSSGRNNIILNPLNNVVDIRHSSVPNQITSFFSHSGRDVIFGFKPHLDQLIFEYELTSYPLAPVCDIMPAPPMNVTIAYETIFIPAGTVIQFNPNNYVILDDIDPQEINSDNLLWNPIHRENALQKKQVLLPDSWRDLPWSCGKAFTYGAATSLVLEVTHYTLIEKMNCSPKMSKNVCLCVQLTMALSAGSLMSTSASLIVSGVGRYLGFSPQAQQALNSIAHASVSYLYWVSPVGVLKVGASVLSACVGSFAGSRLSFFAKKMVDKVFDRIPGYRSRAHEL